jgi:hypothetical protein
MKATRGFSPIAAALLIVTLSTSRASGEISPRALLPAASATRVAAPPCQMSTTDAVWLDGALHAWDVVRAKDLKLAPVEPPVIVTYDRHCVYTALPFRPVKWTGTAYDTLVSLPNGKKIPPGVVSFAASIGQSSKGFFVMSLPSVWKAGGVTSTLGLEVLMQGVLVHEIMHTRQFYFVNPRLADLTRLYHLPDDISDDSLQGHFGGDPAYVKAYETERDLLFAAAAGPDDAQARGLARQALMRMRTRRARWFVAGEAKWRSLDDIFLTMEGLGQWAGLRAILGEGGRKLDDDATLKEWRRGGRYWTQDEGLALFLTIDRLCPGWQTMAFAPRPALAEKLLILAARDPNATP